jgi:hypothetical protein
MVHFVAGPKRWDPVCLKQTSLPHLRVFEKTTTSERFFASGNERSVFDYNARGKDMSRGTGFHIGPQDRFLYVLDLMNMNMDDRKVYITMTYDYLEGELPPGWMNTKTVWLDVDSCAVSEVKAPQQTGSFDIQSKPWTPNLEGRIVDVIGHLHDGKFLFSH